ncbi:unnamed protein product, partial [marine sediment metagenome]
TVEQDLLADQLIVVVTAPAGSANPGLPAPITIDMPPQEKVVREQSSIIQKEKAAREESPIMQIETQEG